MVLSYSFLDLHAGTGATALGFLRAGFRCLGLLEESKRAAVLLRENFPPLAAPLLGAGPRDGDPARLPLQGGLLEERPDVVVGAPLQRKPRDKNSQRRIFGTFVALRHLKPKAVLLHFPDDEQGLEALNYLGALLMEEGYQIFPARLDAAWYGLPEKAETLVLLALGPEIPSPLPGCWPPPRLFPGTREERERPKRGKAPQEARLENLPSGIQVPPPEKAPFPPVTETLALEGLPPRRPGEGANSPPASPEPRAWFGRLMRAWIPTEGPPSAHEPLPPRATRPESPEESQEKSKKRALTLRERARLRSLPDGFHFRGSPSWALRMIQESMPPLLALVLARAVRSILDGTLPAKGFLPEARGEAAPLLEDPFPPRETRRPTW